MKNEHTKAIALIMAAGRSERLNSARPKQYERLGDSAIFLHSVKTILQLEKNIQVAVVINKEHQALYDDALSGFTHPYLLPPIIGGATRQQSVFVGLKTIAKYSPETVIIHDAARPFAAPELFLKSLEALEKTDGSIAALPVADTLKKVCGDKIEATQNREGVYVAQTPQAFRFSVLINAHEMAEREQKTDFTDDASLLEWQNKNVSFILGNADNFKITHQGDLERAERIYQMQMHTRTGFGYDVHSFTTGDFVTLGGVRIPHTQGINAHSDGDVLLHALCDALFGAIADGDIGTHFPPSEEKWKNAPSSIFINEAIRKLHARGGVLQHADLTLVAEAPKLNPHRDAILENLSVLLSLPKNAIGLKATTSEKLGFLGRGEGLAATAVVTIKLP